jgi:hypothetical protein
VLLTASGRGIPPRCAHEPAVLPPSAPSQSRSTLAGGGGGGGAWRRPRAMPTPPATATLMMRGGPGAALNPGGGGTPGGCTDWLHAPYVGTSGCHFSTPTHAPYDATPRDSRARRPSYASHAQPEGTEGGGIAEAAVLSEMLRLLRKGTPLTAWCAENGERGAKLLAEWADTEMGPRGLTKGSKHKALWSCRDCAHEWRARVGNRTKSKNPTGCPACAGSVATATHNLRLTCEESGGRLAYLLGEWNHLTKRMEDFTPRSEAKWKCGNGKCEREWNATIQNRTGSDRPSGCPECATCGVHATATHNLKLTCEESGGRLAHLPGEWNHPTKPMEDFCPGSNEKAPWKCGKCGREWNARPNDRTKSENPTGCPGCNKPGRCNKPIRKASAFNCR